MRRFLTGILLAVCFLLIVSLAQTRQITSAVVDENKYPLLLDRLGKGYQ